MSRKKLNPTLWAENYYSICSIFFFTLLWWSSCSDWMLSISSCFVWCGQASKPSRMFSEAKKIYHDLGLKTQIVRSQKCLFELFCCQLHGTFIFNLSSYFKYDSILISNEKKKRNIPIHSSFSTPNTNPDDDVMWLELTQVCCKCCKTACDLVEWKKNPQPLECKTVIKIFYSLIYSHKWHSRLDCEDWGGDLLSSVSHNSLPVPALPSAALWYKTHFRGSTK